MVFSRSSHPLVARVSLVGSLLTWSSTWIKQQSDQQTTVCWSWSPWNIAGSRCFTFSFNLAAILSCLSASSFSFSCFSWSFASTLRRSCSMIDTSVTFPLPIISFINSFAYVSFLVSLIRTLSLKCLMPFAATLLLSSISFFSSSLVRCLCSSSSSLLSRRHSSMVTFTPSWWRCSSWQEHHLIETSTIQDVKSSNHLHLHTLYLCLTPFPYLLSEPPLLFQLFLPSPLFPPLLQLTSYLPLLLLGPKTDIDYPVLYSLQHCGVNPSTDWTAWQITMTTDIAGSLLLVGVVLGSLVPCFCFLLTLYPDLTSPSLPGFPALDSLLFILLILLLIYQTSAGLVSITATTVPWLLLVSFGPVGRSAPDASPRVARSPPAF